MRGKFVLALIVAIMFMLTVGALSASADSGYGGCTLYYVHFGDTLYSIGRRSGVSPYAIAMANNIHNPDYIWGGTYLCVPRGYGYGYHKGYDGGYGYGSYSGSYGYGSGYGGYGGYGYGSGYSGGSGSGSGYGGYGGYGYGSGYSGGYGYGSGYGY